ncbi:MAG TPA: LysM domain-containing protein [Solirubrobacterales bacterium]|nr:LysM domain-containing protein [Solirubrobacterales bacterium]
MIVVIATALGGGDDGGGSGGGSGHAGHVKQSEAPAHTAKIYEVQSGDTLTSIAHETGVPVADILKLNPGVDPQILISGEKLKLR